MIKEAQRLLSKAKSGDLNALSVMGELRMMEKALKGILKEVEPLAALEADNYAEPTFNVGKFTITKRNGGRVFKYDNIQAYSEAKANLKSIEERAKQAYSAYEKGSSMVDNETGEVITDLPEVTYKKDSLSFKFNG